MKRITLTLLFLLPVTVGLAQLWLKEDEIIKKYGKPVEKGLFDDSLKLYYLKFSPNKINISSEFKCDYLKAYFPVKPSRIINYCIMIEVKYPIKYLDAFIENYDREYTRTSEEELEWIDYEKAVWHKLYISNEYDHFLVVDFIAFELLIKKVDEYQ